MNKPDYKALTLCRDSGDCKIESRHRRDFIARGSGLMAAAATGSLLSGVAHAQQNGPLFAYVGCYTTEQRGGRGKGISVFRVNITDAVWTPVQLVSNVINPSFLCLDREQNFLYSVHGDMDYVTAYAINPADGSLTELNREPCGGTNPVHVAVDQSNQFLVVSNYTSGSVSVMPMMADGSLGPFNGSGQPRGNAWPASHPAGQRPPAPQSVRCERALHPRARQGTGPHFRVPS